MNRRARVLLGLSLILVGGWLGAFAWLLPTPDQGLQCAAEATRAASQEIKEFQKQRQELTDPQRRELVNRLVEENRRLYLALREEDFDARSVEQLRDALGSVADSLNAMASLLDEAPARQLGVGLGEAAEYLEKQVAAAEAAAKRLEDSGELLRADSLRLAELLRSAPLDLDAIAQVHEALGSFSEGTGALEKILQLPQLPAIRTGLQGLEASLSTGADQVDALASYSYPVVYFEGIRPRATHRPFWPSGGKIAEGMHEASSGVKAADKELATLGAELPKVREALASSRKIIDRSHDTLGTVLQYRGLIEPLVKSLPDTAARLAEDLPKVTKQLATTLRETKRLEEVAKSLRATQQQIDKSLAAWPETRKTLLKAAEGLKANRDRLDRVLAEHCVPKHASAELDPVLRQAEPVWQARVEQVLASEPTPLTPLRRSLDLAAEAQTQQARAWSQVLVLLSWTLGTLAVLAGCWGVGLLLSARHNRQAQMPVSSPCG